MDRRELVEKMAQIDCDSRLDHPRWAELCESQRIEWYEAMERVLRVAIDGLRQIIKSNRVSRMLPEEYVAEYREALDHISDSHDKLERDWLLKCKDDRYISQDAIDLCEEVKIYPEPHPIGKEGHHSEVPISEEDAKIGYAIAYFMGDLFVNSSTMPPVVLWSKVVKALRIHGLRIAQE